MAGNATHVLVIDDDQAIREMLALALGEAGHRVTLSGGGALEAIDDVDVAVMDIRLGHTTARELVAAVPALASIPLIVMTAGTNAERAIEGLPQPSAVITKPFDLDVLEDAIRSAVGTSDGPTRR